MTDFDGFKEDAIDGQPIFYDTDVGAVELESPTEIKIEGRRFPMEPGALDGFMELFGMNKTFARDFGEMVGDDRLTDVMDQFRGALAQNDSLGLTVALDDEDNAVTGISERAPRVSMEGFFQIVEDVMDRYDLEIGRFNHGRNGVTIATKAADRMVDVEYLEDESYKSGLEFTTDMGQMDFRYMLERQVCSNGMTAMVSAEELRLQSLKDTAVERFFDGIHDLAQRNFLPEDFTQYLDRSLETPASVAEVGDMFEVLKRATVENGNPNLLKRIPMHRVRAAYEDQGYPVEEMSRTEQKNALTDISLHTLTNEVTYVASHPEEMQQEGFEITSGVSADMQAAAGDLFTKKNPDAENLVPSAFDVSDLN